MPTENDETRRLFRKLLRHMPAEMARGYKESFELRALLRQQEKVKEQLVKELGEAGAANYEAEMVHELMPQIIEEVRTTGKVKMVDADGHEYYAQVCDPSPGEQRWTT